MREYDDLLPYYPILSKTFLFQGVPDSAYAEVLHCLHARHRWFQKGEFLLKVSDRFQHAGVILAGTIAGSFYNETSEHITVNQFSAGSMFGESMACAGVEISPMQIQAVTDCHVIFLDYSQLFHPKPLDCPWQHLLMANLIRCFAQKNVFLNQKVRILSQKSIRDRLLVYLRSLPAGPDGSVEVPFNQTALAAFLSLNRSALSREISRMTSEGLLTVNGRTFRLRYERKRDL
jgi:CRP-like cAMP-binding protein